MADETVETVETEGQEPAGSDEADQGADQGEGSEELSTDDAKKIIADLRKENATRRVKQRELEEALGKAKTPEEYEAAIKANADEVHALEREVIQAKFKLPDALAKRLQGNTREELEADAKELAKLVRPEPEPDLGGGLNPRGGGQSANVKAAIDRARKRRAI